MAKLTYMKKEIKNVLGEIQEVLIVRNYGEIVAVARTNPKQVIIFNPSS